jgi:signal transduction histidine kinase
MNIVITRPPILSVRRSLALAIGIVLIHRLLMIVTASDLALRAGINDVFSAILALCVAVGMFYVARHSQDARHIRVAWSLLGLAMLLGVLGAVVFAIIDVRGQVTFPSIADGFFLAFYPVFGAGLMLMSGPSSAEERIKMLLDIAIVMMAALLVFWIILIAPILSAYTAEPLTVAVAVAYPIGDGALLFAVLRMLFGRPGYVIYLSQTFSGTYVSGDWIATLSTAILLLLIVVIAFQITSRPPGSAGHAPAPNSSNRLFGWTVYIPLVGIVVAYILLAWAHDHAFPMSFQILAWVVGGIIGLAVVRQIVALQENARLTRQLQAELVERKAAEQAVRHLNEELERRVLERTTALTQEIAERKLAEIEREKLVAELEAKNTELEQFTYTVSHDLKAPLITIRGFMGFVEKDALAGNVERVRADMARITEATDKMQRLLTELLELSRIGRMMNPPQAVPFETVVREALELAHGRLEARGVQVAIAPALPTVYGDRARLVEVVQNLVDNAGKFMGDQPEPHIEIGQRGTDAANNPILFVRDNGIGIDPQYQERIFGLFNKLDAQTEGTGVGLALVKRIVEVHGGRIWVESDGLGHGSTFCFTLPVAN